jgi:hypothetical protein
MSKYSLSGARSAAFVFGRRLGVAAALLAIAPAVARRGGALLAQGPADSSVAATSALTPAMTREVYVAAFRASARQWCAAGGADGVDAALASTRTIVQGSVSPAERAGVDSALVDARGSMVQGGGCAAMARPPRIVVVDGFEGHAWNSPKRDVARRDRGERTEGGFTVVTRKVKLGERRFHRIPAEADFTFTTQREQLVRGRYRVAVRAAEFASRWDEVARVLADRYPTLRVTRTPAAGAAAYAASDAVFGTWSTSFTNPDTQALELRMFATPAGGRASGGDRDGEWVIVVDYVGFAGR